MNNWFSSLWVCADLLNVGEVVVENRWRKLISSINEFTPQLIISRFSFFLTPAVDQKRPYKSTESHFEFLGRHTAVQMTKL